MKKTIIGEKEVDRTKYECEYEDAVAFFKLLKRSENQECLFEQIIFFMFLNEEYIEKYHRLKQCGYESNDFHVLPLSSIEQSRGYYFDINLVLTFPSDYCITLVDNLPPLIDSDPILGVINFPDLNQRWEYYRLIDAQFISNTTKLIFYGVNKEDYGISIEESTV